jgi:hypothetical protein
VFDLRTLCESWFDSHKGGVLGPLSKIVTFWDIIVDFRAAASPSPPSLAGSPYNLYRCKS